MGSLLCFLYHKKWILHVFIYFLYFVRLRLGLRLNRGSTGPTGRRPPPWSYRIDDWGWGARGLCDEDDKGGRRRAERVAAASELI